MQSQRSLAIGGLLGLHPSLPHFYCGVDGGGLDLSVYRVVKVALHFRTLLTHSLANSNQDICRLNFFIATCAGKGAMQSVAARAMDKGEWRCFFPVNLCPFCAPCIQRNDDSMQLHSFARKTILKSRRAFRILLLLYQSMFDQLGQSGSQNAGRGAGVCLKVFKAPRSKKELPQDKQSPRIADKTDGSSHRAYKAPNFGFTHMKSLSNLKCLSLHGRIACATAPNEESIL